MGEAKIRSDQAQLTVAGTLRLTIHGAIKACAEEAPVTDGALILALTRLLADLVEETAVDQRGAVEDVIVKQFKSFVRSGVQ